MPSLPIVGTPAIGCVMLKPAVLQWIPRNAPFARPFPTWTMPVASEPLKCLAAPTPASVLVMKLKKATLILRRSQVTQFKPAARTRQLLGQKAAIERWNHAGLRIAANRLAVVQQHNGLTIRSEE